MKNIKVNIVNRVGKRTSTTINQNIAVFYYKYCILQADKDYIKDFDTCHQHDAANAFRNKCIQDFVNNLNVEILNSDNSHLGLDQQFIESRLLHEIKYSN